jgi:hypothetical protein
MPNRFVWVPEPQPYDEGLEGEPRPWPQEVLDRHGLRQLRPSDARRIPSKNGIPEDPRSTVYRAATLLIPERLFHRNRSSRGEGHDRKTAIDLIGEVLHDNGGVRLIEPFPLGRIEGVAPYLRTLEELPRPVVLRTASGAAPNAWESLQDLRQAILDGKFKSLPKQDRADIERISLEHALSGCVTIGPAPTSEPHPGTGDDETVAVRSGYGRRPVMFAGTPPNRPEPAGGGRRPVIAVIDTGYGNNGWFGTSDDQELPNDPDHFLKTCRITRELIEAQSTHVAGLTRSDVLLSDRDGPVFVDPVSQRLAPAIGHGTFIAGLIRQAAPGADVLSIRALRADNIAYESDVLIALYILLAKQIASTGGADVVDVISLSLGYYKEDRSPTRTTRIAEVLNKLTEQGVVVVAAAGNDATARAYMPAALAAVPEDEWCGKPVIGVGALNTNGSVAWFSNTGDSVSILAPGANLVSTFPEDVRGSNGSYVALAAANAKPRINREGFDPDDFLNGFATWSGTSFATPLVAAEIANLLVAPKVQTEEGERPVPGLNHIDQDSKRARAEVVVAALRKSATHAEEKPA